jgi:hypothetical protein
MIYIYREAVKGYEHPEKSKEARDKVEKVVSYWAGFFLKAASINVQKKQMEYEKVYKKYLGDDYEIDINSKDYSLIISNHIGFYVCEYIFINVYYMYRKLYIA